MGQYNYIGVVDDGRTVGGGYLYRVNYGSFSVPVESATPLTIAECVERADAALDAQTATQEPAPTPGRTIYTKLAIRRAMRSLGIESQLDALLDSSSMFRADWTDATEIDLADPVLLQALAGASIDVDAIKGAMNQ
jgi:hypothetical protein